MGKQVYRSDRLVEQVEFRPLTRSDLDSAARLDRLCFPRDIAFSCAVLAGLFRQAGFIGVATQWRARLVGFVITVVHEPGGHAAETAAAEIVTLDVHPQWRRGGLGRSLLSQAHAAVAARGARGSRLHVATDNAAALALYREAGYRITGRAPHYYGRGRDAWAMVRRIEATEATTVCRWPAREV